MSSLKGQMVAQIAVKSSVDVFHELMRDNPHQLSNCTPAIVKACHLHDGQFGSPGSVIEWHYVHEGKEKKGKEVIEAVDPEKKSITFKMIEGDLLELYKSFVITFHVDKNGEEDMVNWIMDYEKLNEEVPDPITVRDMFISITKDVEAHHLK